MADLVALVAFFRTGQNLSGLSVQATPEHSTKGDAKFLSPESSKQKSHQCEGLSMEITKSDL